MLVFEIVQLFVDGFALRVQIVVEQVELLLELFELRFALRDRLGRRGQPRTQMAVRLRQLTHLRGKRAETDPAKAKWDSMFTKMRFPETKGDPRPKNSSIDNYLTCKESSWHLASFWWRPESASSNC